MDYKAELEKLYKEKHNCEEKIRTILNELAYTAKKLLELKGFVNPTDRVDCVGFESQEYKEWKGLDVNKDYLIFHIFNENNNWKFNARINTETNEIITSKNMDR